MVWFGLAIGRNKNADPRWILPLICRVGEVSKREIGSIRVDETETRFEILAEHADNFANAVRHSKHKEGRIWRLDDAEDFDAADPATSERPEHRSREQHAERRPRSGQKAPHPGKGFKPDNRKPPDGGNRHDRRNGEAVGGNGTMKRSWKERKRGA